MSKSNASNQDFLGKSLYNIQLNNNNNIQFSEANTNSLSNFLNNFISSASDNSDSTGNKIFNKVTSDVVNMNFASVLGELTIGTEGALRIVPTDLQRINDTFINGIMLTTNFYNTQTGLATGFTSIKLDVPYVYNEPDRILNATNKEAPDNFLEITNSKFRVTGPFTFIKSTKTSFKSPIITLGYYDREESTLENSTTLNFKSYDKGLVMERVENNNKILSGIKFSFVGFKQSSGRFVMYKDGNYVGKDSYFYPKMDGTPGDELAFYKEYNIDRNPNTIGTNEGNGTLEVDTIYTNNIISSDSTNTRTLSINAYDEMTISVQRAEGDTDQNKNYDLILDVAGKIIMNSAGQNGTIQKSINDYKIQSETGVYINSYNPDYPSLISIPIYIGYESTVTIDNYLKTTYISTGVNVRNCDTMVEIGGDFISGDGIGAGSKLLIDGSITGFEENDIHGLYSKPTIIVPPSNLVNPNSVNYVSNVTLQPPNLQIGSNSEVDTSATLHIIGATDNAAHNYSILSSQGDVKFLGAQSTRAYLGWSNDSLQLYNSGLYINSESSNSPVLSFGVFGSNTNYYTLKRMNVNGTNELFIDAISARINLEDNTNYTITGTIMASQGTNICASYKVEYCLSIRDGVKYQKCYKLNVIVCDIDNEDNYIFDVIMGYSGDPASFSNNDSITVTGININNIDTNWLALLEVTSLEKPH